VTIKSLLLKNFRNHQKISLEFSPQVTFIVGKNTSGKTNILEATYFLAIGKSVRAEREREVIAWDSESANLKAEVLFDGEEESVVLEANLLRDLENDGRVQKRLRINGVPKRAFGFVGNLNAVLFRPEDIELVTDAPSLRRKFLDNLFYQFDREYRFAHINYQKVVVSRNRLLEAIRDEGKPRSSLDFWNEKILEYGKIIHQKREDFFDFVNGGTWVYLDYKPNIVSPSRIEEHLEREIASAQTLVGPHRDDFLFMEGERDLSKYGSRGEQRKAVLQIKKWEIDYLLAKTDRKPVLLLDDIFSELDEENREQVLREIKNQQTILTTTDEHITKEFPDPLVIRI